MTKKKLLILVIAVVVVVTPLVIFLGGNGEQQANPLATLSIKEGDVLVMNVGADSWVQAQVGLILEQGDTIKTDDYSRAEITFFEGSIIELEPGTVLNISDLSIAPDTGSTSIMLKQELGKTISRVKKLTDPISRYEVETPTGVAAARDTIIIICVDEAGITRVFNQEGSVVAIAQGTEVQIPEGMQSIIIPGAPPSLPHPLGDEGADSIRITKNIMAVKGDTITYIYEVTNLGDTTQSNVYVIDDEVDVITYVSGDTNNNDMLDPGETWIFTGT